MNRRVDNTTTRSNQGTELTFRARTIGQEVLSIELMVLQIVLSSTRGLDLDKPMLPTVVLKPLDPHDFVSDVETATKLKDALERSLIMLTEARVHGVQDEGLVVRSGRHTIVETPTWHGDDQGYLKIGRNNNTQECLL